MEQTNDRNAVIEAIEKLIQALIELISKFIATEYHFYRPKIFLSFLKNKPEKLLQPYTYLFISNCALIGVLILLRSSDYHFASPENIYNNLLRGLHFFTDLFTLWEAFTLIWPTLILTVIIGTLINKIFLSKGDTVKILYCYISGHIFLWSAFSFLVYQYTVLNVSYRILAVFIFSLLLALVIIYPFYILQAGLRNFFSSPLKSFFGSLAIFLLSLFIQTATIRTVEVNILMNRVDISVNSLTSPIFSNDDTEITEVNFILTNHTNTEIIVSKELEYFPYMHKCNLDIFPNAPEQNFLTLHPKETISIFAKGACLVNQTPESATDFTPFIMLKTWDQWGYREFWVDILKSAQ